MKYRSRIGIGWLLALAFIAWGHTLYFKKGLPWVGLLILIPIDVFMLTLTFRTYYVLEDDHLLIRFSLNPAVVMIVNFVKGLLGDNLQYVVVLALVLLMCSIFGAKVLKNEFCQKLHDGDSNSKLIHYVVAFLVVIAVLFKFHLMLSS